jgi:branched-chain amino acid transport system substrate-binding protein
VLVLAGCTAPFVSQRHVIGTVRIGADLPLSGDDAPDGLPVKSAVELAIMQAGSVCGAASHADVCVRLQAAVDDDVTKGIHDPATGAMNVRSLISDAHVVGMVGPLYDSLARSELPIANAAHLAIVSPANTDECLTQEPADGHCHGLAARLRPHSPNNYFRVVTTQIVEGAAGADLAFKTLGKRRAFLLNDQTPLGLMLAKDFASRFRYDGGVVVNNVDLGAFDPALVKSFASQVERAKALGTDVVYFGGSDIESASALRREMGTQMPQVSMVGSDRLGNDQFAKSAGALVRGSYYTVVGVDPLHLGRAASLRSDYQKAYGHEPTAWSLQAFDATNLLIEAISRAIEDAGGGVPSRQQVLAEVARTSSFEGLMGRLGFDAHGDTTLKLVTAYQWLAPVQPAGEFVATLIVQ